MRQEDYFETTFSWLEKLYLRARLHETRSELKPV